MLGKERLFKVEVLAAKKRLIKQLPSVTIDWWLNGDKIDPVGWVSSRDLYGEGYERYILIYIGLDGEPALTSVHNVTRDGTFIKIGGYRIPHLMLT